jgi:beta-lactamase superfamily II metal-dependent hydrolase
MKRLLLALFFIAPLIGFLVAAAPAPKTLDFYTIDVEGGKSVLIVSPSGESMLFDAGWPKAGNRDASTGQIADAVTKAGLKQIDYLVLSHFDVDHLGDVPALALRVPIRHLVDHGEIQLPPGVAATPDRFTTYAALRRTIDHTVVEPGDKIPLKGVSVEVVAAGGKSLNKPLRGAGAANPSCAANPPAAVIERDVEDNQSIGLLFTLGNFRMLDLADLESHYSHDLVCPANLIGQVDVYHVNVHGQFKGMSPELVAGLRPTVAIMGNGGRKGGDSPTWPILRGAPGLLDIWQVHYSELGTADTNPPPDFIANLQGATDAHDLIKLSVLPDGTYTVTNTRNGFSKTYRAGMTKGR